MTLVVCTDHDTPVPPMSDARYEAIGVEGLCSDPSSLERAGIANPEALVLHTGEYDRGFIQAAIRRTGVDPLGVPLITLAGAQTTAEIRTVGIAAVARHRSFPGSGPQHAKLRWSALISRRRLFAMNVPQYIAAPSIDHTLCSADRGCRLCVQECPAQALSVVDGMIAYSVEDCVACGICTTTCPTDAAMNPATTPRQIAVQIHAQVADAQGSIGIRYHCREARPEVFGDGWFPVEVPCTGMLTIGWLLAPLVIGAAAVAPDSCSDSGCPLGNDDRLAERSRVAVSICEDLGLGADRICQPIGGMLPTPLEPTPAAAIGSLSDTDMFLALAAKTGTHDHRTEASVGAVGIVSIDEALCTACQQCTNVCPTRALSTRDVDGGYEITFDATACIGCSLCVATCPEQDQGVITVAKQFDTSEIAMGRHTVVSGTTDACEICGGPIAPSAMLERIRSMLGPDHARTVELIGKRCLTCR